MQRNMELSRKISGEALDNHVAYLKSYMMNCPKYMIREDNNIPRNIAFPQKTTDDGVDIWVNNIHNFCFMTWGLTKEGYDKSYEAAISKLKSQIDYLAGENNSRINYKFKLT